MKNAPVIPSALSAFGSFGNITAANNIAAVANPFMAFGIIGLAKRMALEVVGSPDPVTYKH